MKPRRGLRETVDRIIDTILMAAQGHRCGIPPIVHFAISDSRLLQTGFGAALAGYGGAANLTTVVLVRVETSE